MRLGIIVPALDREAALVRSCLDHLAGVAAALPEAALSVVLVMQPDSTGEAGALSDPEGDRWPGLDLTVIRRPAPGVSAARNAGLDQLDGRCDAIQFVDVAVRPTAGFLRAALGRLGEAPLVTAPVAFQEAPSAAGSGAPGGAATWPAHRVVFRGFVWSSLFRADAVAGIRFDETIGPGTPSRHQAGEDSRFLHAVLARHPVARIPFLAEHPVARLPRGDLREKVARYAFGQGYLVGQYVVQPGLGPAARLYFVARGALFVANSLSMLLRGPDRGTGRVRLAAFRAGLRCGDPSVPPLWSSGRSPG